MITGLHKYLGLFPQPAYFDTVRSRMSFNRDNILPVIILICANDPDGEFVDHRLSHDVTRCCTNTNMLTWHAAMRTQQFVN